MTIDKIRNIAIIAHVDHGKTTLIDKILEQVTSKRDFAKLDERAMDSNDIEKERGITILAKNTAVYYKDYKINIVDTPGHADFGGEVERVLNMVDAVLLVVDAFEGPMPQTKFVLKKAMSMGLQPILVINKIDRKGADPARVLNQVYDLFIDLDADDNQLEFPIIYASAKEGYIRVSADSENVDMSVLLDMVIKEIKPPTGDLNKDLQVQISTLDYDNYVGVIATGRIKNGTIRVNQMVEGLYEERRVNFKVTKLLGYEGLKKIDIEEASAGDIVSFSGTNDFKVGMTIGIKDKVEPLPLIKVDDPTISMYFMVNDSPFAGKEGKFLTSRHIKDRLDKEILSNVALHVESTGTTESFKVSGRGELHLSILVENMRREGYELQLSRPQVIIKEINGEKMEPYESVTIEVPEVMSGSVIEKLNKRFGKMQEMEMQSGGIVRMIYIIPSRGLLGYRSQFMTDTKGEGVLYSVFDSYGPIVGEIMGRTQGALISQSSGKAVAYSIFKLQDRGQFFITHNDPIYEGMVIGINPKKLDMAVNPTKTKQLTNVRSSGTDEAVKLTTPIEMGLEKAIDFIEDDELVEVTPLSVRIRKRVLSELDRRRAKR
jgi:GTP-binding protein